MPRLHAHVSQQATVAATRDSTLKRGNHEYSSPAIYVPPGQGMRPLQPNGRASGTRQLTPRTELTHQPSEPLPSFVVLTLLRVLRSLALAWFPTCQDPREKPVPQARTAYLRHSDFSALLPVARPAGSIPAPIPFVDPYVGGSLATVPRRS